MSTAMFDAREVLIPGSAYDRVNPSNGMLLHFGCHAYALHLHHVTVPRKWKLCDWLSVVLRISFIMFFNSFHLYNFFSS